MINNKNLSKGNDVFNETNREHLQNYFNPYEYNLSVNKNERLNKDIEYLKSKSHLDRNYKKK